MGKTHEFSPCRKYRYTLWREVNRDGSGYLQVIGLNPSTADEVNNDPTVRRCMALAKRLGCRWLCMTNAFAYRATDPKVMKAQDDPVGPDNDRWLLQVAREAVLVVAAWGTHGIHRGRGQRVVELVSAAAPMSCLGRTKDGHPKHPLYLANDTPLEHFA